MYEWYVCYYPIFWITVDLNQEHFFFFLPGAGDGVGDDLGVEDLPLLISLRAQLGVEGVELLDDRG